MTSPACISLLVLTKFTTNFLSCGEPLTIIFSPVLFISPGVSWEGSVINITFDVKEFVSIKGWKALGNQIVPKKRMSGFKFIIKDVAESEDHDVRIDNNNELTLF